MKVTKIHDDPEVVAKDISGFTDTLTSNKVVDKGGVIERVITHELSPDQGHLLRFILIEIRGAHGTSWYETQLVRNPFFSHQQQVETAVAKSMNHYLVTNDKKSVNDHNKSVARHRLFLDVCFNLAMTGLICLYEFRICSWLVNNWSKPLAISLLLINLLATAWIIFLSLFLLVNACKFHNGLLIAAIVPVMISNILLNPSFDVQSLELVCFLLVAAIAYKIMYRSVGNYFT